MTQTAPNALSAAQDPLLTAEMPRRPLGRTGHLASLLTVGGVKWDTRLTDAEAVNLLHRALDLGVNTLDTAHAYGNGESERKMGLALEGRRDQVFLCTKTLDRTYDGAMRQMELSLRRLRTQCVDLMYVHAVDTEEQGEQVLRPRGVLRAMEEMRANGHLRFIGVSGHWVKHVMQRLLREYPFDAVLFPAGLFNLAYGYCFLEEVLPLARERGMAVLGMKVFGAGRVAHARSIEPYLRYTLHQSIDTAVIGFDSVRQLEEAVRIVKSLPPPLDAAEYAELLPECLAITQEWAEGEFDWVSHYR